MRTQIGGQNTNANTSQKFKNHPNHRPTTCCYLRTAQIQIVSSKMEISAFFFSPAILPSSSEKQSTKGHCYNKETNTHTHTHRLSRCVPRSPLHCYYSTTVSFAPVLPRQHATTKVRRIFRVPDADVAAAAASVDDGFQAGGTAAAAATTKATHADGVGWDSG